MIRDTYKELFSNDEKLAAFVDKVSTKGFVALPHFFDDETEKRLFNLRAEIGATNKKNDTLAGTFADEVLKSPEIFEMCARIHKARCAREGKVHVPIVQKKQSVGVAYKSASEEAKNLPTEYHYDGAYVNIVIAVLLPKESAEGDGDLIMFPNLRRKYPRIICAPLSSLLRHSALARKIYGYTTVHYTEGAAHLFWGDLSLHGVPSLQKGERMVITINSHW